MLSGGPASGRIAYAHSVKGSAPDCWEKLPHHLVDVGRETAVRAAKFGCSDLGTAIGHLHDFGKFKEAFQRYLHGEKVEGKAHSAAGALYATKHFDRIGRFIAHTIAGHHAGLKDGLLATDGRLASNSEDLDRAMAGLALDAQGFVLPVQPDGPNDLKLEKDLGGFQYAFLIRMLFSCLIDADRICTERFYAGFEERNVERGPAASVTQLSAALTDWMTSAAQHREADGASRCDINLRRAKILTDVRAHSADAQGIFTLTVPTGGGKTLTGLDFALRHAVTHDLDRVIVVVPFTSVIEQSAAVYRKALGPLATEVLEHHSAFDEDALRGEDRQAWRSCSLRWRIGTRGSS